MVVTEPDTSLDVPAAPCVGDGVSGKRVEILYGYPADRGSRFSDYVPTTRNKVAYADHSLNKSVADDNGHHLRWLCREDQSAVRVRPVKTVAIGNDGVFTFSDLVRSLDNRVGLGLGPTNFVSDDRVHLVFMDHVFAEGAYKWAGQGQLFQDDRKDPALNDNNLKRRVSLIGQWSGSTTLHELGHNLGSVQDSAPRSSGNGHCYDDTDVMCYDDGGSYFANGGTLRSTCTTVPHWYFDCGKNDYYNRSPLSGSYLANHWNTVRSGWLDYRST